MTLEVLFFDGCPSHEQLLPSLRQLAAQYDAELRERRIETPQDAQRERFLGSPSVRVDGVDVDPGAHERTDFGLKCRLYRSSEGQSGLPPKHWIDDALREATAQREARAGAGWFGISHLVAARTGYAGCPELGAIREVKVGCLPWRMADRRLG